MNASTPECAECGLPLIGGLLCVGGHYQQPVRVEEPAGERVAQSANADVPFPPNEIIRHLADATDHLLRHHNCDTLGYETWQAALDAARALPGALPVPVRDETEALRAALDAAKDLYERVEMDESVGICLSERTPSLRFGDAITAAEGALARVAMHPVDSGLPSEVAAFVSMVEALRLLEREMEQASRGKQGDYVADWLERVRAVLHDFDIEAGS